MYIYYLQIMEEFKQITGQAESPEDAISINWQ